MWFLLAVVVAALAGPSAASFDTATRLIDRLYLERDDVDEVRLLRAAALRLEEEVHWLFVRFEGRRVHLRHGDGRALGTVEATSMLDLPRALRQLTELASVGAEAPIEAALIGLGDALDRHSRLLSGDRLARFNLRLTGLQVGVGASVTVAQGRAEIDVVHPRGPADAAGLRVGDVVLRVDGRPAATLDRAELTRRLHGAEGTEVVLDVVRADPEADAGPHTVVLTRAPVVVPNVQHAVLDGGVGYVHIDHVSQRTRANLDAALDALAEVGALRRGLVLDLRQNTGGSMREAARLADRFLAEGLILRTLGRDGRPVRNLDHEIHATVGPTDLDVPIVIVTDGRTASGAEILAGALVEHGRAVIVGTRTYGKGTVQKALPVDRGAHLKLTIARYELAHERPIDGVGIAPDVAVGRVDLSGPLPVLSGFERGWDGVVPEVSLGAAPAPTSGVAVELARRTLLDVDEGSRRRLLPALRRHARTLARVQEDRLGMVLAERGQDWRPQDRPAVVPRVRAWAEPMGEGAHRVSVSVHNPGAVALGRVAVQISADAVPELEGVVLLVGHVPAGDTVTTHGAVTLPAGLPQFEVAADLAVWADGLPRTSAGGARLSLPTGAPDVPADAPQVAVRVPSEPAAGMAPLEVEVRHDGGLAHVVLWVNGEKVGWSGGGRSVVVLGPRIPLLPGANHVRVEAVDTAGQATRQDVSIWAHGATVPEAPSG